MIFRRPHFEKPQQSVIKLLIQDLEVPAFASTGRFLEKMEGHVAEGSVESIYQKGCEPILGGATGPCCRDTNHVDAGHAVWTSRIS